jgi:hypothetical protein
MNELEITYTLINLLLGAQEGVFPLEVWLDKDSVNQRNILHWAVLNKER